MDYFLKMKTDKEVANFFWHGNPMSKYEIGCISSFIKNNWIVRVWAFSNIAVPDGAEVCNANLFYKEEDIQTFVQKKKVGCLAAFSDAFRYKVLKHSEGWWFDTDCICLKDQSEFKQLYKDRKIIAGYEKSDLIINGAVLKFVDTQLASTAETMLEDILTLRNRRVGWGEIGPRLVTSLVDSHSLSNDILPIEYFYPVHCKYALDALDPKKTSYINDKCKNSFVYHCWNEMLSRANVDKNIDPPVGSFLYNKFSHV